MKTKRFFVNALATFLLAGLSSCSTDKNTYSSSVFNFSFGKEKQTKSVSGIKAGRLAIDQMKSGPGFDLNDLKEKLLNNLAYLPFGNSNQVEHAALPAMLLERSFLHTLRKLPEQVLKGENKNVNENKKG